MKLLVDNQLPVALARFLDAEGLPAEHLRDIGLQAAPDPVIWEYARLNRRVIVTKDEDFPQLVDRYGSPPQVVWVRLGNCRKVALLDAFKLILPTLRESLIAGNAVTEVR